MLTHMQVFNKYYMPAIIETLAQRVEVFNEASGGSIRLTTAGFNGDFLNESFYASLQGAQRRVDRYAANDAVAATPLTQLRKNSVKVAGGFGPIPWEPSQLTWLDKPTAEALEVVSRQFTELLLADQVNTAVASLVAAIESQADAMVDVSATDGMTYAAANRAHAKFGDASGSLVAQVMNGVTFHALIGHNLANAERLFDSKSVNVVNILGRRVVVTDAPALYQAGTPNKVKVLSLTEGACTVFDGSDIVTAIDTRTGNQRIETNFQADYAFGLGLKGYSWDEASGGKSPTDAELRTGANWDKVATSIKATAGVITIADADK